MPSLRNFFSNKGQRLTINGELVIGKTGKVVNDKGQSLIIPKKGKIQRCRASKVAETVDSLNELLDKLAEAGIIEIIEE